VALGGQLYRQVFARGIPKSGLEKLGRTPNRRGTKVRFKPDAQIFGDKAKFSGYQLIKPFAAASVNLHRGGVYQVPV
jgi:topoisomerase-4 subunit B